ncbi:MAG TPA: glycosyltransferase, partial [Ohtaekwangia sp.]|nr:glycosyltransferase [Ohtaekwangia sp.]
QRATIQLLFSGTIAASTGVFTAINLASALYALNPRIRLTIMGYCAIPDTREALHKILQEKPYISFTGGGQLVPHTQILEAINYADYGIIAYPPNPSTDNTIPTKLYEYVGSQLPVLLINHPAWVKVCQAYNAAIVFDPGDFQPAAILRQMDQETFYTAPVEGVFWEDEAPRLLEIVKNLNRQEKDNKSFKIFF